MSRMHLQLTPIGRRNLICRESYGVSPTELRALVALASLRRAHGPDASATASAVASVTGDAVASVSISLRNLARLRLASRGGQPTERLYSITMTGARRLGG
jgi:hypothetical protein